MLIPTGEIVTAARVAGCGVGAFNVITVEHAEAVVTGAEKAGLPVILQISENAVRFHHGRLAPIAAAARAIADAAGVDVALHLDHVESDDLFDQAAAHGFGSAMYDASKRGYDDNVRATNAAVRRGHARGLWVESEIGEIGGKDGAHAPGVRTDPGDAAAFVTATGVDALAVAVGSSHAMRTRTARLDHELIRRLRDTVPVPLVLHGSSGVPADDLVAAVGGGMVKINIGTALNGAFTGAIREALDGNAALVDPRLYLASARTAISDTVADTLSLLRASSPPTRRQDDEPSLCGTSVEPCTARPAHHRVV
ncbi:class II fructose-bisphosphate aldolase [Micromonospora chokoriensis]